MAATIQINMQDTKILNDYSRLADAALSMRVYTIVQALTDNPLFKTPKPSLAELTKVRNEFEVLIAAAKTGDKTNISLKNAKRDECLSLLKALSRYVTMEANGDRSIFISSGFPITSETATKIELNKPQNISASETTKAGEIHINCDKTEGARSYLFQYTPDPLTADSIWLSEAATLRSHDFKNLESGKKYWFRIVAIGSYNQQTYSDPIAKIVQ